MRSQSIVGHELIGDLSMMGVEFLGKVCFVSRAEEKGDIFITRTVLKRCRVLWPSPNERLDVRWMVDAQGRLRVGKVAYPVGFVE